MQRCKLLQGFTLATTASQKSRLIEKTNLWWSDWSCSRRPDRALMILGERRLQTDGWACCAKRLRQVGGKLEVNFRRLFCCLPSRRWPLLRRYRRGRERWGSRTCLCGCRRSESVWAVGLWGCFLQLRNHRVQLWGSLIQYWIHTGVLPSGRGRRHRFCRLGFTALHFGTRVQVSKEASVRSQLSATALTPAEGKNSFTFRSSFGWWM